MSDFGTLLRAALKAKADEDNVTMVAWLGEGGVWSIAPEVHLDAPVCPELVVYPEGKVPA